MRKPIIAGNWKMNKTPSEARELVSALIPLVKDAKCDVVVCTPAVDFAAVSEVIKGTNIKLGAENMHWKESGAYTGELSAAMLKESGVEYVILGHSERRQYFKEDDALINRKVKAVLANGMKPILCVGEKLEDREANKTIDVVSTQTVGGLEGLSKEDAEKVVVAYEPVWAIGTGKTATPAMAQEVHAEIRKILAKLFGEEVSQKIQILYGGSMKPENADALLAEKDIDGGLIGGAALKADSFAALVESAKKAAQA